MGPERLAELFDRQTRRWEIDRRAGMPQPRGAVVSISHMPASGGGEVAQRVAEWLDYGMFGLDAIRRIASDARLRERLTTPLEPAALDAIEARVRRVFPGIESELGELARVVATLGERGMAVVVGRGATAILPPARTLRVLIVAPRETRVERLARSRGLGREEAEAALDAEDAARLDFLRAQLGLPGDDPGLYDLIVNTQQLSIDAAAALVVEAVRRRFPAPLAASPRPPAPAP
jgi:cytidylate kinase